jgi:hypothetical protein
MKNATGDPRFDSLYQVLDAPGFHQAVLARPIRKHFRKRPGLSARDGVLQMVLPERPPRAALRAEIDELTAIARAIRDVDPAAALLRSALDDADPGFRAGCLRALDADPALILAATATALAHPDPRLRLAGARAARDGEVLAALAVDEALTPARRALALTALLAAGERAQQVAAARVGLASSAPEVLAAAARLATGRRLLACRDALPAAALVCLDALDGEVPDAATDAAEALIEALDRLGGDGEGALLACLERAPKRLGEAALRALSSTGGADAVPRIRAVGAAHRGLRRDARAAIAAIQERLPDDSGGGLSLLDLEGGEGALSLPAVEGGLSPADEDG